MESLVDRAKIGGIFELECWRVVKPGEELSPDDVTQMMWSERRQREELRRLMWTEKTHNVWTAEGLNSLLNVYFHAATQLTTWYCLIFESDTTPADGTTYPHQYSRSPQLTMRQLDLSMWKLNPVLSPLPTQLTRQSSL